MGFFQNLKEDYAAALDELLGTDTLLPEEEDTLASAEEAGNEDDVDSDFTEEQEDLPATSMEEAVAEAMEEQEPVFQELDLDDLDLEGMEQRILNWNLLRPSEENTGTGTSFDGSSLNKMNGYEEAPEPENKQAPEELMEPAEEAQKQIPKPETDKKKASKP